MAMGAVPIRNALREAIDELEAAQSQLTATDEPAWLDGTITQLQHYLDHDTPDPEARALPPPGVLETIHDRLLDSGTTMDDEATQHVQLACERIQHVMVAMDERVHDGRLL